MKSNYLEKLLNGAKVEWKTLGEITNYEQPSKYLVKSKNYNDTFNTPVLTAGKTFILGYTDEKDGIYKASENPAIIFDDFTTANKWVDFDFKVKSSAMKIITSKNESDVLLKYIYYWLNTLPNQLIERDHKRQWINNFSKKLIPIPPLDEQERIVSILDKFDTLTNSITEGLPREIELRQKQYEYYRDKLLTPIEDNGKWLLNGKEFEWKKLGEVAKYSKERISFENLNKDNYVGVDNLLQNCGGKTISTHIPKSGNLTKYCKNDILIGNIRPYLKKIWYADRVGGTSRDVLVIHPVNRIINSKFLYYILSNDNFFYYDMKYANYGKMPRGNKTKIMEYPIPIPSLSIQKEIVRILDKFNILTNSITEELRKEIKLRKKQYEYYRDKIINDLN